MTAAEASFKRAMTTPLPASEPDLEPRILSPPHQALTKLQRPASPAGEDKASLSPQPPSVPTLSVSMPSPEVDKKTTPLPSHEGSVETLTSLTNYETPSDMLSEMQETEAELIKAEDEVKMEADDDSETDRKPTRQSLDRASNWQQPYGDAATYEYDSSPYDGMSSTLTYAAT